MMNEPTISPKYVSRFLSATIGDYVVVSVDGTVTHTFKNKHEADAVALQTRSRVCLVEEPWDMVPNPSPPSSRYLRTEV